MWLSCIHHKVKVCPNSIVQLSLLQSLLCKSKNPLRAVTKSSTTLANGDIPTMAASISLQDRNKQIVAEYYREYWSLGNPDIVDKLCAEDFIVNYPMHGPRQGREAAKQMLLEFKRVRIPMHTRLYIRIYCCCEWTKY